MRLAEFKRIREKLTHDHLWPFKILSIRPEVQPGLVTETLDLATPLSVICGANGAGKTTILRLLWAALDPDGYNSTTQNRALLTNGRAELLYRFGGQDLRLDVAILDGKATTDACIPEVEVTHVDTSMQVPELRRFLQSTENIEELIEASGTHSLSQDEVAEVSHLLRRIYVSVTVSEIELVDQTWPFFAVSYGGVAYDSRTMGTGELSGLFLWWSLKRAASRSILLIEEPECFLSPLSQKSIAQHLCSQAFNKRLTIFVTSHSAEIVATLPSPLVKFVARHLDNVPHLTGKPIPAQLNSIGIYIKPSALVLVEDEVARAFFAIWTEKYDPQLLRRCEIMVMKGEGNIHRALDVLYGTGKSGSENFMKTINHIRIIAIFDGDQRSNISAYRSSHASTLPGMTPPERLMHETVVGNVDEFAKFIRRRDLSAILSSIQGIELHDWFIELCRNLNMNRDTFISYFVDFMMTISELKNQSDKDFQKFSELLPVSEQV